MGGDKQVTIMVLKVDLQCHKCYRKIKKILCQFPQIQDQVYDEKQNTVTIKVICCSPEKIKQKIKCKGGDSIISIEIKVPEKPKDPPKPQEPVKPKDPPKPKEPEKPKDPPTKPKDPPLKPKVVEVEKVAPPPQKQPTPAPVPIPAPAPVPCVPGFPQGQIPFRTCCTDCIEGRPGGPCYYGCGPPRPPPCYQYDGYYGRPVYDSYGGGRSYYASRCDYFPDENSGACAIM